jgi:hypothetical protein
MKSGDKLNVSIPRHAGRGAGADQRPPHPPVRVHDGEPPERVRADPVRPHGDQLQPDPVRVPPDVQHGVRADPRDLGRAQLQRGVLRRDRPLPVLQRRRGSFDPVRPGCRRQPDRLPGRATRRERRGSATDDGTTTSASPASRGLWSRVQGCTETNAASTASRYTPVWPDGNTRCTRPRFQFTSARRRGFDQPYDRAAFEADLPAVETTLQPHHRRRVHPDPDDRLRRRRASSTRSSPTQMSGNVHWQFGNDMPGKPATSAATSSTGSLSPASIPYLRFVLRWCAAPSRPLQPLTASSIANSSARRLGRRTRRGQPDKHV